MLISSIVLWIINIGYFFAIVPQVFLNYKMKTTCGLSSFYLLGYFNGYAVNLFYVYCLNFHLAYKILAPILLLTVSIMFFQVFLYDRTLDRTRSTLRSNDCRQKDSHNEYNHKERFKEA